MWDKLITAGTSLLGGFLARDAQSDANDRMVVEKEKDRALSKEFAQNGVSWKVDDARRAGIHPLIALGGTGASYSGSAMSFAPETGVAHGLAAAGQDIGRAVNATRTASQRDDAFTTSINALALERAGLENELLKSKIGQLRSAQNNPPMPTASTDFTVPVAEKPEERPLLRTGRGAVTTDDRVSNAEDFEKRYGEMSDWAFGPYIAWRDLQKNYPGWFLPEKDRLFNRLMRNMDAQKLREYGRKLHDERR